MILRQTIAKMGSMLRFGCVGLEREDLLNNKISSNENEENQVQKDEEPQINEIPQAISRNLPYDCVLNVGLISDIIDKDGKG
mmetsp:Transcript_18774/g.18748  ORF Transcript_18774/g.18748 Transcript_18774/m.18748 type:complete len:82 (-) Transcript_18774:149-394(-)